ncbi:MAG: phosphoenolpyruvate--protein phosphotransferase [Lachnospiraceae bacterium]|nr:phosphoenolpyruvate--protein phosphotransferase [Lachnospiraceae bacterium]MBP5701220.1 phosphoenolpyruvate--protein phosphotransferase [Lachnospiraceae bacterium]
MKYKGLPVGKGIVMGRIRSRSAASSASAETEAFDADLERMRFFDALLEFEGDMKKLAASAPSKEGKDIISGQIMIARDPVLSDEVTGLIDSGKRAGEALEQACRKYEDLLRTSGDELFMERSEDLFEVKSGILSRMGETSDTPEDEQENDGDVIFAERLSVAEVISLLDDGIKAVVMKTGTATSHVAVILRSMGITAVFGVAYDSDEAASGTECIVDGNRGTVIVSPSEDEKNAYKKLIEQSGDGGKAVKEPYAPSVTMDGITIDVMCNIGFEKVPGVSSASDGAGLVRTEFLFMSESKVPTEDEQADVYSRIADSFRGKPVVIRTLDAGGDKDPVSSVSSVREENPALGLRGLRASLSDREHFKRQIRAILRASDGRDVSILVPMVTSVGEILNVRNIMEECRSELGAEGKAYRADIKLGCMIETPAAVLCADALAGDVDFFSIGTNDLAQYIMCADRTNPLMSELCSIYQPAVLRAVNRVCECASAAGIPVTICGEAASYPDMLPVFIGMGVKSFSVDPGRVSEMKHQIRKLNVWSCRELAGMILRAGTKNEIEKLIR